MWSKLNDLEEAKKQILTEYGGGKAEFHPTHTLAKLNMKRYRRILDFGCGVGRNLDCILDNTKYSIVYGYDYPNMVELAKQYLGMKRWKKVIWENPPIENLITWREYDLIIAIIVLQHIPEKELRNILTTIKDILTKDGMFFVHSRGYLDEGKKNIWKIIMDYFVNINPLDIEDGSENHQTAILKGD